MLSRFSLLALAAIAVSACGVLGGVAFADLSSDRERGIHVRESIAPEPFGDSTCCAMREHDGRSWTRDSLAVKLDSSFRAQRGSRSSAPGPGIATMASLMSQD
jgi:hypothetical protein